MKLEFLDVLRLLYEHDAPMRVTFEVDGSRVAVDVDRVATRAFRLVVRVVDLGAEPVVVAAGREVSAT